MKKLIFKSSASLTILFILFFSALLLVPVDVFAQLNFTPQVDIPGGVSGETSVGENGRSDLLGNYIIGIYKYSLAVAGLLAAIVLMGGGLMWLVSGGNQTKIGQAKEIIGGSIIGLGLLFSAYLLFNTINPDLLEMKVLEVEVLKPLVKTGKTNCCSCQISVHATNIKHRFCESSPGYTNEDCQEFCQDRYTSMSQTSSMTRFVMEEPVLKENCLCTELDGVQTCVEIVNAIPESENGFVTTNWTFQTGIENQIPDMSNELISVLNCMRNELDNKGLYTVGVLSSISDSNVIGKLEICNTKQCTRPNPCQHSCESCHYGGSMPTNKSYAVDFADDENAMHINKAFEACDSGGYIAKEKNVPPNNGYHIHMSVSKCPKN